MSYSSAEGEHTAIIAQGLRVPASLARVKYSLGVVWQMYTFMGVALQNWAMCFSGGLCSPVCSPQLCQQHLGLLQISRGKALGAPVVDRCEQLVGLTAPALLLPQAGQAGGSSQLHDCPL